MSGGSYDYFEHKLDTFTAEMDKRTDLRKAFAQLLVRVSKAVHAIEWVDSGDWCSGDEDEAIKAALGKNWVSLVLLEQVAEAKSLIERMTSLIGDSRELTRIEEAMTPEER